jgi:hypothetical protein
MIDDWQRDHCEMPHFVAAAGLLIVATVLRSTPAIEAQETSQRNNTYRIGYISDQLNSTMRITAINQAVKRAQAKGLMEGFEFR